MNVEAYDNADIVSIAVGGANANNFTLGGSVSENDIGGSLDAHIGGEALVTALQSVTVQAHDDTQITAIAGAVARDERFRAAVGGGRLEKQDYPHRDGIY